MSALRQRGLTLVEILTVTTIVGLLIALAATVWVQSVASSKAVHCLENLRSIWRATSLYAGDHDGLIPPYAFEDYGSFKANQPAHIALLGGYGLPKSAFFCPLDPHAGTDFSGEFYTHRHTSYWMGWRVYMAAGTGPDGTMLFDPSQAPEPSSLMYLSDMSWLEPGPDGKETRRTGHGKKFNALYADGRVKGEQEIKP